MAKRRTERGLRRPTEDLALGRMMRDEKRAAPARRRQARAEEQRHGPGPPPKEATPKALSVCRGE